MKKQRSYKRFSSKAWMIFRQEAGFKVEQSQLAWLFCTHILHILYFLLEICTRMQRYMRPTGASCCRSGQTCGGNGYTI